MAIDKPAVEGGMPIRSNILPYATQWLQQEEIDAVVDTLKSVWITTGPREKEFSGKFAQYVGAEHGIAVNSCTSALNLCVEALGIGPGDEVVTTPLTFVATAFAIVHAGATPVFADIKEDTYNIDPASVEEKITDRTKAIIPVHYGGNPVDLDAIYAIAKKHGLKVIEDCAHAAGAEYHGRKIGSTGDLCCFSFHAIKNMTTVEGGMITVSDPDMAALLKTKSFFGIAADAFKRVDSKRPWEYEASEKGFKCNMPDISAAVGLVQLGRLDEFNSIRAKLAANYSDAFSGYEEIVTPVTTPDSKSAWHLYVIRLDENRLRINRDEFLLALRAENIFANYHYLPIYRHSYFKKEYNFDPAQYPVCEQAGDTIATLPLFPRMSIQDQQSVIDAVTRIIEFYRK